MNIYLKIKIKSLAAEAADIRRAENKLSDNHRMRVRMRRAIAMDSQASDMPHVREQLTPEQIERIRKRLARSQARALQGKPEAFWGLRNHRTNEVRKEARSSFIAYGFLRGVPYKDVEVTDKPIDTDRVESLIAKFGTEDKRVLMQRFEEWLQA